MNARQSTSIPLATMKSAILPILLTIELYMTWYAFYLVPTSPCGLNAITGIANGACARQINHPLYYVSFAALVITTIFYIARNRRRYAATISVLSVPLSILLANEIMDIISRHINNMLANLHIPSALVNWIDDAIGKPNIMYLAAAFIGTLLLTPAIFQLLHNRAYCRLFAVSACIVSFGIYAAILLFPNVLFSPFVLHILN
jgi:hypothetical protein